MEVEFDRAKDRIIREKHGISLEAAAGMDFDTALVVPVERADCGEARYQAVGLIGERPHVLAFTMRGQALRAISLRKANRRERSRYERRR